MDKYVLACLGGLLLLAASTIHAKTIRLVYTDAQGTVVAKTDVQGTIIARYDYRPYGAPVFGGLPPGPGYTGHVNDADSGLVYMQQRYYDPVVGRFLSVDPNPENLSRYHYANNNPVAYIDPTGMDPDCSTDCMKMRRSADKTASPSGIASEGGEITRTFHELRREQLPNMTKDEAAKRVAPTLLSLARRGNVETCASACPRWDETGKQIGWDMLIGTSYAHTFCTVPVTCNGGGPASFVEHNHPKGSFIAKKIDEMANVLPQSRPIMAGMRYPAGQFFSTADLATPVTTYLVKQPGGGLIKHEPGSDTVETVK